LMSTPIKTMSSPKITPLNVHFIVPNMSFHPYYIHPGFIWGFFMNVGRDYKKLLRALFHIYININIYISHIKTTAGSSGALYHLLGLLYYPVLYPSCIHIPSNLIWFNPMVKSILVFLFRSNRSLSDTMEIQT
jgi:hypothetical protein